MTNKLFTTNMNGIRVVRCCASCKFNCGAKGTNEYRICSQGEGAVHFTSFCTKWEMHDRYGMLKYSEGRIKRRQYLMFLTSKQPVKTREKKKSLPPPPLKEVHAEFEKKYGTIYEDF